MRMELKEETHSIRVIMQAGFEMLGILPAPAVIGKTVPSKQFSHSMVSFVRQ